MRTLSFALTCLSVVGMLTGPALAGGGRQFFQQQNVCVNNACVPVVQNVQHFQQLQNVQQVAHVKQQAVVQNVHHGHVVSQAVSAIPVATVPVAVDVQAYQYRVNSDAFNNYRSFMAQKYGNQLQNSTQSVQSQSSDNTQQLIVGLLDELQKRGLLAGASDTGNSVQSLPDPPATNSASSPYDSGQPMISNNAQLGAQALKTNCMQCHQEGNSPKGGLALFDLSGRMYPDQPWRKVLNRIRSDDPDIQMPPSGKMLEREILNVADLAVPLMLDSYNPFPDPYADETSNNDSPF